MTPLLDLFRTAPDGSLAWLEAQTDIATAKIRLKQLALNEPGEYFIFDQATGQKIFLEGSAAAAA